MERHDWKSTADAAGLTPAKGHAELLRWDEAAMQTGVAEIDAQHRELIAKINELYRIHLNGATMDDIKVVLKFLDRFAQEHFKYEEELMEKRKCPQHRTNCHAHARFLLDYKTLVSNFSIDQDPDQTASEIERMAARWLVSHICNVDVSLREAPRA